jgi:hypothetical protein
MLNDAKVLNYVKRELGFPFMQLEWSDQDILDHIKSITLRDFSYYSPNVAKISINTDLVQNKVPGIANEYYIHEPEGREIFNIVDIYFSASHLYALGHPPFGVFSHFSLREYALQVAQAMETKMFSSFDYTFEFRHPNIFRVSPKFPAGAENCTVEYERMQAEDFSEIPNDIHYLFLDLALADVMIALGRVRKRYGGGNLRTPFGEIPLESEIFEEGKEKRANIVEKLERLYIPNVRIDHG